jgi:hypothetical protein
MTTTLSNWKFKQNQIITEIPEGKYGFVYKIVNNVSGREYIGKKFFYFQKTRQVKGKKKKYKAESDWKDYYGSNEELLKDVELLGKDNFERYILYLCKSKGECTYFESKCQFELDVLLYPEKYYNTWIMCKVHRKHIQSIAG